MSAAATRVVRLRRSSGLLVLLTSVVGLAAFLWPLLIDATEMSGPAHSSDAPWIFAAVLPLFFAVVMAELAQGSLDAKAVAMLGVLAACGSVLRLPGGLAGFEPVFFLFIPAGRVLGRGFGFVVGALTMLASALLTGGVGPWLPFQMMGAAWVGFFAGCLPRARGRVEIAMLAAYGFVAGLLYGALLNMWFWPFAADPGSEIAFVPGASLWENLRRFWGFHLATSFGFDLPRAVLTVVLLLVAGRAVLAALRRASRRAAFGSPVAFASAVGGPARAPVGASDQGPGPEAAGSSPVEISGPERPEASSPVA